MKKSAVAVLLAASMALSLTACGGSVDETTAAATEATEAATTAAETEAATTAESDAESSEAETKAEAEAKGTPVKDPSEFKVGMVTDVGGVNDGSFNQSSWEGLQRAGEELGIQVNYLESKNDADYTPNIENFVDEDYDLIISVGYMLSDATRKAAEAYPDQQFAIIDDAANSDLPNVTCLMFEQAQSSYLVGYVAGKVTESNKVGFVIGMASDSMHQFGYGYLAGVKDANPDAEILQYNANAFNDPATGKSATTKMVTDGADVVFHAAGGTGLGVIEGCKENGIWAIGVDSDQSSIAPETILTSAMKRVDNASFDVAEAALYGTLEGGVKTYDITTAGVDIAPTTDNLTPELLSEIEDVKAKIASGEIVVPNNKADFEAAYGDIYTLDD